MMRISTPNFRIARSFNHTPPPCARPIKHLRHLITIRNGVYPRTFSNSPHCPNPESVRFKTALRATRRS